MQDNQRNAVCSMVERIVFEVTICDLNEVNEETLSFVLDSDQLNVEEHDCAKAFITLLQSFNLPIEEPRRALTMESLSELVDKERIIFHSMISIYRKDFDEVERSLYIAHANVEQRRNN